MPSCPISCLPEPSCFILSEAINWPSLFPSDIVRITAWLITVNRVLFVEQHFFVQNLWIIFYILTQFGFQKFRLPSEIHIFKNHKIHFFITLAPNLCNHWSMTIEQLSIIAFATEMQRIVNSFQEDCTERIFLLQSFFLMLFKTSHCFASYIV